MSESQNVWSVMLDGDRLDGVSPSQIKQLVSIGKITRETLVMREGMAEWVKASRIKGLFPKQIESSMAEASPQTPQANRSTHDTVSTSSASNAKLAKAAMITSIPGLCCFPAGLVAIILGGIALFKIKDSDNKAGQSQAIIGVALGTLSLVFILAMLLVGGESDEDRQARLDQINELIVRAEELHTEGNNLEAIDKLDQASVKSRTNETMLRIHSLEEKFATAEVAKILDEGKKKREAGDVEGAIAVLTKADSFDLRNASNRDQARELKRQLRGEGSSSSSEVSSVSDSKNQPENMTFLPMTVQDFAVKMGLGVPTSISRPSDIHHVISWKIDPFNRTVHDDSKHNFSYSLHAFGPDMLVSDITVIAMVGSDMPDQELRNLVNGVVLVANKVTGIAPREFYNWLDRERQRAANDTMASGRTMKMERNGYEFSVDYTFLRDGYVMMLGIRSAKKADTSGAEHKKLVKSMRESQETMAGVCNEIHHFQACVEQLAGEPDEVNQNKQGNMGNAWILSNSDPNMRVVLVTDEGKVLQVNLIADVGGGPMESYSFFIAYKILKAMSKQDIDGKRFAEWWVSNIRKEGGLEEFGGIMVKVATSMKTNGKHYSVIYFNYPLW